MSFLVRLVLVAGALLALEGGASAQVQDFSSCGADLPQCSGEINDCCYRAFNPIGASRAVIIPMDRCHQQVASSGSEGPPSAASPAWCGDPIGAGDDGMFQAYGLVYRLLQRGIKVHWIINPSKDPPRLTTAENASSQTFTDRDIDFWVLNPDASAPLTVGQTMASCTGTCVDPVKKINTTTMVAAADTYNYKRFPVRGGAYIIAAEDRARFDAFIKRTGEFASLAGNSTYDFSKVDMYELAADARIVYQDFRTAGPSYQLYNGGANSAPVASRLDYAPPRLARLAPAGVSEIWLTTAKLNTPASYPACKTSAFSPSDAVFCDVSQSDIAAGALVSGNFQWAWIDNWNDSSPCGTATETAQVDAVRTFMTAVPGVRSGGSVMFMDAVIGVFESPACGSRQPAGKLGTGVLSSTSTPGEPLILRSPASQFMQWGDLPTQFAAGSAAKWRWFGGGALGYDPSHQTTTGTLTRLVSEDRTDTGNAQCTYHKSSAACDVSANALTSDTYDAALYMRYLDNVQNGIVFYQGGNNVNQKSSHLRLILNSLLAMPAATVAQTAPTVTEKSRSAPIVATVGSATYQFQGSFELTTPPPQVPTFSGAVDAASFQFPFTRGHLRTVPASSVGASATTFENLSATWDVGADGGIPSISAGGCSSNFRGTCRTVFTTVTRPTDGLASRPGHVYFTTGNLNALKPLIGPFLGDNDARTLITRLLAGVASGSSWKSRLGGIDRSTPAVIEPSPLIPSSSGRPTMIYVGATDGMLHAICAEAKGACPAAGRELWAFIPRTQLPFLRLNTARIDGSPKVSDVFGDFAPGDGEDSYEWRTVLTFQTGFGTAGDPLRSPAAWAIDITDPAAPVVLWERTTRATRGTVEQGVGYGLAMGDARVRGRGTGLTFIQTNNGGTGTAGFWLGAVETATGALVWEVKHLYPAPRASTSPPVPESGVPGGAVAIGTSSDDSVVRRVLVPSLYGEVWMYEPGSGASSLGAGVPLMQFTSDYHPVGGTPTIYQSSTTGRFYAVAASGGYSDPIGTSWAPDGVTQYALAASIETAVARAPITEAGTSNSSGDRAFVQDLGASQRSYAQAVVSGDELFVVTDTSDLNNATAYAATATGTLRRYSLSSGTRIGNAVTVIGGGSAVDVTSAGNIHLGTGTGVQKVAAASTGGGVFNSNGRLIERDSVADLRRPLWIST